MKTKILPLIIFTLILCRQSFSQEFKPSYIVKNHIDTIFGTGFMNRDQESCIFKRINSIETATIYPTDIDAFRIIDGSYYVSRQIEEPNGELKWCFLEYLVEGEIDLFAISNSARFFIKKENEPFLELDDKIKSTTKIDGKEYLVKDNRYIGLLKVYMSDAPELYPQINKLDQLNQRELVKISIDYHNAVCQDYECVNYTKKIPKFSFQLELLAGGVYHNNYYTPQAGLLLHISKPLYNYHISINFGFLYSDRFYIEKNGWEAEIHKYVIKFPVSFQMIFGKAALKPTVAIGFTTGSIYIDSFQGGLIYSISDKFVLNMTAAVDGVIHLILNEHQEIYNNPLGHSFNIGVLYKIH